MRLSTAGRADLIRGWSDFCSINGHPLAMSIASAIRPMRMP